MFPLLSFSTTGYSDRIINSLLRWIVLVEIVQNAWSFSVNHPTEAATRSKRSKKSKSDSLPTASASSSARYVWGRSITAGKDHRDQHRLEDIFLADEGRPIQKSPATSTETVDTFDFDEESLSLLEEDIVAFRSYPADVMDQGLVPGRNVPPADE